MRVRVWVFCLLVSRANGRVALSSSLLEGPPKSVCHSDTSRDTSRIETSSVVDSPSPVDSVEGELVEEEDREKAQWKRVADDGGDDDDADNADTTPHDALKEETSDDDDDDGGDDDDSKSASVLAAEEEEADADDSASIEPSTPMQAGNATQQWLACISSVWREVVEEADLSGGPAVGKEASSTEARKEEAKEEFRRQLLQQFNDPSGTEGSGRRSRWLDQEFVLTLKGLATLATNPMMVSAGSKAAFPHLSRAVRLAGGRATQSMQLAVARALGSSIGARTLTLTRKSMDAVRDRVLARAASLGLAVPKPMLVRASLLNILFHYAAQENLPLVLAFAGDVSWVSDSISTCDVLISAVKNAYSTVFFLLLSSHTQPSPAPAPQPSSSDSGNELMQQLRDLGLPLPPGDFALPQLSLDQMQGSAFQLSMKNGSVTLAPMGSPQGGAQGAPNDVMRRIMADQQRRMQGDASNGPQKGPPAGAPEAFRETMQDPEIQSMLRDLVARIISKGGPQFSTDPSAPTPLGIEVRVMLGAPTPMGGPPAGQPMQQSGQPAVLGGFFKGLRPRSSGSESSGKSDAARKDQVLLGMFESVQLHAPADHGLRARWEQMVADQVQAKVFKANARLLKECLESSEMELETASAVAVLESTLGSKLMSRAEAKRALEVALTLQAAKRAPRADRNEATESVRLSTWALETGLSTVIPSLLPRLGKPVSRSKEDVSALAVDKHEKALVANVIAPQDIGVTYDMIGGLAAVKETLRQCITYPLKYPRLYQEGIAAEAVKGVLLFGPPGTGKTMLAKAVATEGGATFLTIDTSSIENKWLGESEKNAKAVFTLARRLAPCVIYLDEVDSILSSREHSDESSHGTLTSVKTTLMQEWDGLRTTKDRVVVIASTNRPFDLDEAVLRRLPRRIMVDLPDLDTRIDILNVTLSSNRLAADVNISSIAEDLDGYSGSDIKEVCREAVVRVSHEKACMMETDVGQMGDDFSLRPVNLTDFKEAMRKLKASVDEGGRELAKVIEWNERYGEVKRKGGGKRASQHMSMYI